MRFILTLLFTALLTFSFTASAASNWQPGSIQWYVEKWNNQEQRRRIASPQYQQQVNTQKLLNRSFSTATKPVGATGLPTYQPQKITANSFARGMLGAIVRKHPIAVSTALAYGAYECLTSSNGWCVGDEEPQEVPQEVKCPNGGTLSREFNFCHVNSTIQSTFRANIKWTNAEGIGRTKLEAANNAARQWEQQSNSTQTIDDQRCTGTITFSGTVEVTMHNPDYFTATKTEHINQQTQPKAGWDASNCHSYTSSNPGSPYEVLHTPLPEAYACPPDSSNPALDIFKNGPFLLNDIHVCFYDAEPDPAYEGKRELTLDDLKAWGSNTPDIYDVDEEILTDPVTGKPNSDFFDKPQYTPISGRLSDAFTDIATGVAQSGNPSAPHYYPPDVLPDLVNAREKFHKREQFTDPLTNTTVDPSNPPDSTPFTPPTEVIVTLDGLVVDVQVDVDMNWDDFPGITQQQYEESNNKLSDAINSAEMPDLQTADGDFLDTLEINPDLPFQPFNFGDIWPIQGGQCSGFAVTMSVRGDSKSVMMDKHCPPYNEWAHPLISWFLQLLTLLHIFHLFSRMISAG